MKGSCGCVTSQHTCQLILDFGTMSVEAATLAEAERLGAAGGKKMKWDSTYLAIITQTIRRIGEIFQKS
jgi:hypothetical protein